MNRTWPNGVPRRKVALNVVCGETAKRLESGAKRKCPARAQNVAYDHGCVKTLGGTTAPGILGSTVMRRAKKRKNLSSARHYDQIRFHFHTTKVEILCRRGGRGD